MKRKIYDTLLSWKRTSNGKSAVMLDGARRGGKSYIAEEFAKNEYAAYLVIDFATAPRKVKRYFEEYLDDLDMFFMYLCSAYKTTLVPGNSVIIFDEVQRFPRAREAIKYLVKDGRFHYIETGSLISIRKNVKNIVIPSEEYHVKMFPMDFEEFAWATGNTAMLSLIDALRGKPLRRTHIFIFGTGRYRLPMFKNDQTSCCGQFLRMHRDLWDGKQGHLRAVASIAMEHLGIADLPDVVFSSNTGLDGVYMRVLEYSADAHAVVLRAYSGIFGEGAALHHAGIPCLAFATEDARLWIHPADASRFSSQKMLRQTQTVLDCLTLLDDMPRESIGRVQKQPLRSRLPYAERGTKHEKSDD